ncbi:chloramphenicol phosphotransferase CPT family protein [Thaumasiovibrio sp. DFM-14]|uniref:chloramphenicol phosphotransferase CPT family protein n=1 Tax=Thaumasiovibrio sp. DFM-14 TaxID=3384792 RepID=UPI0039A2488A
MYPDVILLNGTGSSGKTSLAKELQELLNHQYLNFSIDSVLYALPPSDLQHMMAGRPIERDGFDYAQLVKGYHHSVRALLETGCRVIIDNAWIDKAEVDALNLILSGFDVVRVQVECDLAICEAREHARGDRAIGLAKWEFPQVHQHMHYDTSINTSCLSPAEAAARLHDWLKQR